MINDLTYDIPVMVWYKRKFKITVAFLIGAGHPLFGKQSKKSGENLSWKKKMTVGISNQGLQKAVKKCSFQMFDRNTVNLSIIYKEKELNYFGQKIRIFDISKI